MTGTILSIIAIVLLAVPCAAYLRKTPVSGRHTVSDTIDINLPVRAVFDHWTEFERYPEFVEGVEEVRQLDHKQLLWRATVLGESHEWKISLDEQIPDRSLAWTSHTLPPYRMRISFQRLSRSRTRLLAEGGWIGNDVAGDRDHQAEILRNNLRQTLRRCKTLLETRGRRADERDYARLRRAVDRHFR